MTTAFCDTPKNMACLTKNSLAEIDFPHLTDLLSDVLMEKMELGLRQPEDFLSEIQLDKPGTILICGNCEEDARASSRCKDCDELLCENCNQAHAIVKLTKDHIIIPLSDGNSIDSSYSSLSGSCCEENSGIKLGKICDLHPGESVQAYCENCCVIFCTECNTVEHKSHSCFQVREAFENARNLNMKFLNEAKTNSMAVKECISISERMRNSVNSRSMIVTREIKNMMCKFHMAINERESELLEKLKQILIAKNEAIEHQIETFRTLHINFSQASRELTDVLECGAPIDIIKVRDRVSAQLKKLRAIRNNMVQVDDTVQVVPPDWSILLALSSMGDIAGYNQKVLDKTFLGNDLLRLKPFRENESYLYDFSNFKGAVPTFRKQEQSPFHHPQVTSRSPVLKNKQRSVLRDYCDVGTNVLIIGSEGDAEGQLCRPWGVCCSSEGNIIVADRSNNRVQIFSPGGKFLYKFGTHGSAPGCFDRPAGITTDSCDRIIVADKDNHRVQIFTSKGGFVLTFGEKGSDLGQFNYPWDVAADSQGRIAVSDSRNHRVQLFDREGTYIAQYGYDASSTNIKQFDSPRGVCFTPNGCVVATDFNNHRLVVIDPNFRSARFIGVEGCGEKQFLRPQGIAVDATGNIIVADSRNHRIQIFKLKGNFIHQFGTMGKEPGQMDRPSGLCVSHTGKIIVVDFGNNRVQVF